MASTQARDVERPGSGLSAPAAHKGDERDLIARWIRPHPDYGDPADAVLAETQVPVYAIVGEMGVPGADAAGVADGFEVPVEAVEAAMAYYRRHRALLDARLFTGSSRGGNGIAAAARP